MIFVMDRETQNIISLEVFHFRTLRIATALPVPPSQMGVCYALNQITSIMQELSADVQNAVDSTNAAAESVKAQDILIRETADTFEEIGENVGNLIGRFNDIGTSIEAIGRSATEINNNIASLAATSEEVASLSSMGEEGARTAVEKFDEFDILLKGIYDQAQRLK